MHIRINEDYIEDIAQDDLISSQKQEDIHRDYRVRVFIYYFINNAKQKLEYNKKLVSYIERLAAQTFEDFIVDTSTDQEQDAIPGDFRNSKVNISFSQKVHIRDLWRFIYSIYKNTSHNMCKMTVYVESLNADDSQKSFGQILDQDVRIVIFEGDDGGSLSKRNRMYLQRKIIEACYPICVEDGGEMYQWLFHYLPGFKPSAAKFECELEIGCQYGTDEQGSPLNVYQDKNWKPYYKGEFDLWLVPDDNKEPIKVEYDDQLYDEVRNKKMKVFDKNLSGYIELAEGERVYMTMLEPHFFYKKKVHMLFIAQKETFEDVDEN